MVALKCLFLVFLLSYLEVECSVRRKRIVGGDEANVEVSLSDIAEEDRIADIEENEEDLEDLVKNVTITKRRRFANFKGILEPEGYHSFHGIRYAEPPVGLYRFQRPQLLRAAGDIDATKPGPPCVQPTPDGQGIVGSEDCLFLNVYTPQLPKSKSGNPDFPVFMWIHGGGFRRGSASQYNPRDLVKKGLVVVTVQYRLGSLGFLSTHRNELPGNTALFDLGAAMEWIQKYIIYFGGDPKNIVPAGQGSGASAATMLSLTGLTQHSIKGLFAMSGSPISSFAVDNDPKKSAATVSEIDNCHSEKDALQFVRCMQQLPVENIIKGDNHLQDEKLQDGTPESFITSLSSVLSPGPSVERNDDDRFLPYFLSNTPIETMKAGNVSSVPLLTGVTKEETSTSVKGGLATKLLERLEAVPDFLEKSLVPNLLNINTGLFSNGRVNPLLGTLFSNNNYLKAVTSTLETAASAADKAIEVTTDAIFNLPAFTTSLYWTKKNKAYLYSFEHEPEKSSSQYFLDGLPLVQTKDPKQTVEGAGHGDDLIYLFDVRSLDGAKIPNTTLTEDKDLRVRDHFTTMVAEFVKTGTPRTAGQEWNSFSPDGEYLKMTDEPTIETGFRKCQMGLWAGIPELLKSSECSFLNIHELVTNTIQSGAKGLLGETGLEGLTRNSLIKTATNLGGSLQDGLPVGAVNPSNLPVQVLPVPSSRPVGGLQGIFNPLGSSSSTGKRKPSPNTQPVPSLIRPLGGGGIFG